MSVSLTFGKKPLPKHGTIPFCTQCGSTEVGWDAYSEWDIATQQEVLRTSFDQSYCFAEDGEERVLKHLDLTKWVEIGNPDVIPEEHRHY